MCKYTCHEIILHMLTGDIDCVRGLVPFDPSKLCPAIYKPSEGLQREQNNSQFESPSELSDFLKRKQPTPPKSPPKQRRRKTQVGGTVITEGEGNLNIIHAYPIIHPVHTKTSCNLTFNQIYNVFCSITEDRNIYFTERYA